MAQETHRLQHEAKRELNRVIDSCSMSLRTSLQKYILEGEPRFLETRLLRVGSLLNVIDITDELGIEVFEDAGHILA